MSAVKRFKDFNMIYGHAKHLSLSIAYYFSCKSLDLLDHVSVSAQHLSESNGNFIERKEIL